MCPAVQGEGARSVGSEERRVLSCPQLLASTWRLQEEQLDQRGGGAPGEGSAAASRRPSVARAGVGEAPGRWTWWREVGSGPRGHGNRAASAEATHWGVGSQRDASQTQVLGGF